MVDLGYGRQLPPTLQNVQIYFLQKRRSRKEAGFFYQYQQHKGWKKDGLHIKNWKTCACDWIWQIRQRNVNYKFIHQKQENE